MNILSPKIKVAVLRGGPSYEYDVSLKTGGHVLSLLREMPDVYEVQDIFISKDGFWHSGGLVHEPHKALLYANVVWNGLHGHFGEDGKVQRILESLQVPFTGSSAVASAIAMDKARSKDVYNNYDIPTPKHEILNDGDDLSEKLVFIFRNYLHPVIVKPTTGGSSIGMKVAHTYKELEEAVKHALEHAKRVIVEEFIRGKEASCGVVENARGERLYALLPIEIRRPKNKMFFDYEDKYSGETEEICPGNFTKAERELLEHLAKKAHEALSLRHYSRSDFIITPKGKIYILETNSLPGFTEHSLLPKSLHAVGWHPRDFVDHVIKLAVNKS